jgi:DNA-binding IclR family transcriptional regulator
VKKEDNESKSSIQVIERMMKLLDALSSHSAPLNLKQLAHLTGLHPSTAHRILGALVDAQLVDRMEPGGVYRLGIKLLALGTMVKHRLNIRYEALPFMQQLHDQTGEAVNLSVRQGDDIVYVERTSSGTSLMRVIQIVGARAPLHITAVGKIFLAEDGRDKILEYARRTGLPGYTMNTITDATVLIREVEKVHETGVAFDNEEAEKGVCCIGAGIHDSDGDLIAGLSLSAPVERMNKKLWVPLVKETAEAISKAMGKG